MTAYENTGEESRLEEIQRTSEASTCNAMFPGGFCSNRSVYRHCWYQVNSSSSRSWRREGIRRAKGAFVSERALHSFDGDKPNSVGSAWRPDDHSSHPPRGCGTMPGEFSFAVVRRYPRIKAFDRTIRPSLKDYLPKREELIRAALAMFVEGMKALNKSS